jgi:hypothetical protein
MLVSRALSTQAAEIIHIPHSTPSIPLKRSKHRVPEIGTKKHGWPVHAPLGGNAAK